MVTAIAVAALLLVGAPLPLVAGVAATQLLPPQALVLAVAGFAILSLVRRLRQPDRPDPEAAFLGGIAAELRAGSGLRAALVAAATRAPDLDLDRACRLAAGGRPMTEVAETLAAALPAQGAMTAGALRSAAGTGGKVADVFDALALLALEEGELAGERRAGAAQARLSAWIVAGLPVVLLVLAAISGRLSRLAGAGVGGVVLLGVGIGLLGAGTAWVAVLLRRGRR